MNPEKQGTKVAAHYRLVIGPNQSATVRLRLSNRIMSVNPPNPPLSKGGKGDFKPIHLARILMKSSLRGFVKPTSFTGRSPRHP